MTPLENLAERSRWRCLHYILIVVSVCVIAALCSFGSPR